MKHEWIDYQGLKCCRNCGLIRRRDRTNDEQECRGPVKVALRTILSQPNDEGEGK